MTDPTNLRRPRALIFAYSAEPGRGSEPGGGWAVIQATARFADCVVLVKPDHMAAIRAWQQENDHSRIDFVEVHPPLPAAFRRGHRIGRFLAYLAWLRAAFLTAQRLHADVPFDFAQHVTYAVFWLPSPVVDLGIPSVWGPVCGGVTAPRPLWPAMGLLGTMDELLDFVSVRIASALPSTRRTWRRATVRLVQNEETLARLPEGLRPGTKVVSVAPFLTLDQPPVTGREPYVVFPSALVTRKGPRLALQALAQAPGVRLVFANSGTKEVALRRMAGRMGLSDRVEFVGQVPRSELFLLMAEASAVLFTGVREEGGLALAEAMALGTPVVLLAVGGARTTALQAKDPQRVALITPASRGETARALGQAMQRFVDRPAVRTDSNLDVDAQMRAYGEMLSEALDRPVFQHANPGPAPDPSSVANGPCVSSVGASFQFPSPLGSTHE